MLGLETVGRLPTEGGMGREDIRQREWRVKAQTDGKDKVQKQVQHHGR